MNKNSLTLILTSIICVFFLGCAENVKTFKPQNDDEAMIKQVIVDLQEGTSKRDVTLYERHIDDNVNWIGKYHFTNKDQLIAHTKKGYKAEENLHKNASFTHLRINFKSEDKVQVLVKFSSKYSQDVHGRAFWWELLLKRLNNGNKRWVIYKKMYIPKQLEKFYQ